jgi:putative endonuclease
MVILHLSAGKQAEAKARMFLEAKGLTCITHNWRCPTGEIDLIMRDGEEIVFVEVRSKASVADEDPSESITPVKQKKIVKTALLFLQQQQILDTVDCRFDVISLSGGQLKWFRDAFTADGIYD